jgi:hypothetical protein
MTLFQGSNRFRMYFCLSLALVNFGLGYRSALAEFISLAPAAPLARTGGLLGDLDQIRAKDCTPKPTRQQLSTTTEKRSAEKTAKRANPFDCHPARIPTQEISYTFAQVKETQVRAGSAAAKPHYLRPSESVPRAQLPPPA